MNGVHYSSEFNSQFFSDCCGVAVTNAAWRCVKCHRPIYPYTAEMTCDERDSLDSAEVRAVRQRMLRGRS